MTEVVFPQMSDDPAAVGVIITWFAANGEPVTEGSLIAEVAMDKVDQEVKAPVSGRIEIVVAEEQESPQGGVIARIT